MRRAWATAVVAAAGVLVAGGAMPAGEVPDPPVAVFAELNGSWTGTFVGWDAAGRELYRIRVRQSYRTVDETTQRVEIEDRHADGTVVTGEGMNHARRREDGTLVLRCRVTKSNGERVEHAGTLVEGPHGGRQILWHSREGGRVELFRERVVEEGGETVYAIDGMGRYGDGLVLMAGRYRRLGEGASLRPGPEGDILKRSPGSGSGPPLAFPGPEVFGIDLEELSRPLEVTRPASKSLPGGPQRLSAPGAAARDSRP